MEIPPDRHALIDGFFEFAKVPGQIIDPVRVMYLSVQKNPVIAGLAVFGDVNRQPIPFGNPPGPVAEDFGRDSPFERGSREARIFLRLPSLPVNFRTVVYIETQIVDGLADRVHICGRDPRRERRKFRVGFRRIVPEKYRIQNPGM